VTQSSWSADNLWGDWHSTRLVQFFGVRSQSFPDQMTTRRLVVQQSTVGLFVVNQATTGHALTSCWLRCWWLILAGWDCIIPLTRRQDSGSAVRCRPTCPCAISAACQLPKHVSRRFPLRCSAKISVIRTTISIRLYFQLLDCNSSKNVVDELWLWSYQSLL